MLKLSGNTCDKALLSFESVLVLLRKDQRENMKPGLNFHFLINKITALDSLYLEMTATVNSTIFLEELYREVAKVCVRVVHKADNIRFMCCDILT